MQRFNADHQHKTCIFYIILFSCYINYHYNINVGTYLLKSVLKKN